MLLRGDIVTKKYESKQIMADERHKSKLKKDDIIRKIIDMRLIEGKSTRSILKYLEDDLGYGHTQKYQYLKWARERIKEEFDATSPEAINEAIGQYEEVMEKVLSEGEYTVWNNMARELNKMKGLYIDKVEHSGTVDFKAKFPGYDKNEDGD